jgi:hypothetical protein
VEKGKLIFPWLILFILLPTLSLSPSLQAQQPTERAVSDLTFADLGFTDQTLTPARSEQTYSLVVPSNLDLIENTSYLELSLSHTVVLSESLTTLNVTLDDDLLGTITLDLGNARGAPIRFDLEPSSLATGRNMLSLQLDTSAQCDDVDPTLNVEIFESSRFHLEYELAAFAPDLALYPAPFYEPSFLPSAAYLVLPDQPSASDLSAAATVSAGLGKLSDGELSLTALLAGQLNTGVRRQNHLIVIGQPETNTLLDQLKLPLALTDQNLAGDQGVIQILTSPWNPLKLVLVVSGLTDQGVINASLALNRETIRQGMRGQYSIVSAMRPPTEADSLPRTIDRSLSALGYSDQVFCGTEPHTLDIDFSLPLGWNEPQEPSFVLLFSHSQVVDSNTSALLIQLNGVPVGSTLLDGTNVSEGMLQTDLPARLIQPGDNRITLSIEMNHPEADNCRFIDSCQFSTVISSDSYVRLPFTSQDGPSSLGQFPYPFNQNRDLNHLAVILPDEPRSEDLDALVRLAGTFGATMRGDQMTLSALTAAEVTAAVRQDKHLILLGQPTTNSVIQSANDQLPQPFQADTNLLEPQPDSVFIVTDTRLGAGLIQELRSPWNPARRILVLTGTTENGLDRAYETLFYRASALAGNLAVAETATGALRTFYIDMPGASPEPQPQDEQELAPALLIRLAERWW